MPYGKNTYKIQRLRKQDPEIKASDMAKILGISRERVRQILLMLKLPTQVPPNDKFCKDCGVHLSPSRYKRQKRCVSCRKIYIKHRSWVEVQCTWCGKSVIKLRSSIKNNLHFNLCNRKCWHEQRVGITFRDGKILKAKTGKSY